MQTEEKEKLVHTIESLYAGLILIGGNGTIMQMNARARQIFNVTSDPAGRPFQEVIQHETGLEILNNMLQREDHESSALDDESKAPEEISVP